MCDDIDISAIPDSRSEMGSLPNVWTPSTWNGMPRSVAMRPISSTGISVPLSLFAVWIEIRTVSGRIARRTSSGSTSPSPSTGRYVTA